MNVAAPEAIDASWRRAAFVALAVLGWGGCLLANWPGHFSVDSVTQLAQGRIGLYDDWHPPIMAWLLGVADRVVRGAPLFFALDAALCVGAFLAFALSSPRPRLQGLVILGLALATPQMVIFQGVAWKDLLFADTTLAGFAALAMAGRAWGRTSRRSLLLGGAFVLFLIATLTRQTGFAAPLGGALVLAAFIASRAGTLPFGRRGWVRGVATALVALAALFAAGALVSQAFAARGNGQPGAAFHLRMLQTFDLAGALKRDPGLPLDALHRRTPAFEWFERAEAAPHYTASTVDFLDDLPAADALLPPHTSAVSADWTNLILRHPGLWLRVRTGVFLATLSSDPNRGCPVISTGIWTDDEVDLASSGLALRRGPRDDWDGDYVDAFARTPVLSHLAWGLAAVVLLGMAVRDLMRGDRRPEVMAVVGLLGAALAFCASFFVISVACDYRYLIVLDLAVMAAATQRASARASGDIHAARPRTAVARRSSLPQPTR